MDVSLDQDDHSGAAIAVINKEYATLFDLLQQLTDCLGINPENRETEFCAKAGALIEALYERAHHLFTCEEGLLRDANHPDLPKFLRERRIQLAELQLVVKQMKGEIEHVGTQSVQMLRSWIVENQVYGKQAINHACGAC